MPRFIPYDYNQHAMIAINFQDQLQPGTFEHAIHYLIDNKLDLTIFYPNFKNEDNGRPAYDPAILLKIVLFAYSKGMTSSRYIEWCCRTNIIFKALSCDTEPHFTTIASFVSTHSREIENLFEQVLLICDQQGLLGHELFAIDGCKMPSNASKEWSGTFKELTQKRDKIKRQIHHHILEHKKYDINETRDNERLKRIQQTINTLNQAHNKIDQFLKTAIPRMGKGTIQGHNGVAAVDKKHQIIMDASGIVATADTGFCNEANMKYLHENNINGFIPDNRFRSRDPKFKDQKSKYSKRHSNIKKAPSLFIANDFDFDPIRMRCRCPVGEELTFREYGTDRCGNEKVFFNGRLNQCRYCKEKTRCMRNPSSADDRKGHGRQVSFILKKRGKANYTDWMKRRVDSDYGKQIYSYRMSVVEPVFGNINSNKKLNRFSLRGKEKVQGQWRLFCLVHNIEKLNNYGQLAA
ncbi:MAG: IS1182 family transposase [Gammaproteobacteria bacterium]|nr:IS1182 family transposase [Gammaproteobacteria bacterium]